MKRIDRLGLVVLILISWTSCDQMTKNIAKESLAFSSPISLLNDSIRIEYTENAGAVIDFIRLGIGPLRTGIFNMADVAIVTGVVTFLLFSAKEKAQAA